MNTLEITSETYQEIARRAVHSQEWAQYLLLVNACMETVRNVPTKEQCDQANVEQLLIESLERTARTIQVILPGGLREFQSYLS